MAKRARGRTTRPGQRAPLARGAVAGRPATRPARAQPASALPAGTVGDARPATLTDDEEARAAELEARILAAERAAEETASRSRRRESRAPEGDTRVRSSSIALRASEEYAYVSRDVRRIALIGGSLLAFLIGLWAVTAVTGAGPF